MNKVIGSKAANDWFDFMCKATDNFVAEFYEREDDQENHIPNEQETYLEDGYYTISCGNYGTLTGGYEYLADGRLFLVAAGRPPDIWYLENVKTTGSSADINVISSTNYEDKHRKKGKKKNKVRNKHRDNDGYRGKDGDRDRQKYSICKTNTFILRKVNVDGYFVNIYDLIFNYGDYTVSTKPTVPTVSDDDDDFDNNDNDDESMALLSEKTATTATMTKGLTTTETWNNINDSNTNNNNHVIHWKAYLDTHTSDGLNERNNNEMRVFLAAENSADQYYNYARNKHCVWLCHTPNCHVIRFMTLPNRSNIPWTFQRC